MANVIVFGKKSESFLGPRIWQGDSVSSLLYNIVLKILARATRQEKKGKIIQTGKVKVEFSLFSDNMILHIGNSKASTKSLRLRHKFSKVVGYKTNAQK